MMLAPLQQQTPGRWRAPLRALNIALIIAFMLAAIAASVYGLMLAADTANWAGPR